LAEAEETVARNFELGTRIAHPIALASYATQLASIRNQQGRSAEVSDLFAQAAAEFPSLQVMRTGLARLSGLQSNDQGETLLAHDVATGFDEYPFDITWLTSLSNCAATAVRLRHHEAAQLLFRRLAPFADHLAYNSASDLGVVARRLGLLADLLGRENEAEENFRLALELHERLEAPYWIARTQVDYAQFVRSHRGDTENARYMLSTAGEIAVSHGYAGLSRRVTAALQ